MGIWPRSGTPRRRGFLFAAAAAEDVVAGVVLGADEIAHVLDEAEDGDVDPGEHRGGLARVDERDFLRRGDDDGAGQRDGLDDGELDVAGAGREIEDEEIEAAPIDLPEELLGVAGDHRAAEDGGRIVIEEEAHGHQLHAVAGDGDDAVFLGGHGALVGAEHEADAGAVDVAIAKADAGAGLLEGDGEIGGDGDLPTPPLPLATAMTCLTPSMCVAAVAAAPPGAPWAGAWISMRTRTAPTPGRRARARSLSSLMACGTFGIVGGERSSAR